MSFVAGCNPQNPTDPVEPPYYDAVYTPTTTTPTEKLTLSTNGETEYKIVIPATCHEIVDYAAKELKLYFDKATGTNIQIVTDEGLVYTENEGKYLSVGETAIKTATNVEAKFETLDRDGFVIKTVGDDYVMCGGGDYGTLYSVYEFLHQAFDWETYAADEIYYKEVEVAEVEKLNIEDKPAFKNRTGGYFEGRTDAFFTAKMRTFADYGRGIFGEDLWGVWGHSNYKIIRGEGLASGTYTAYTEKLYPQFYGNQQLCLTADGIVDAFSANLAEFVWQQPNQLYFMMGALDNSAYCTCPNCSAYDIRYDSDESGVKNRARSVLMMEFFNNVCKKVNEIVRAKFVAEYGETEGNAKADVRLNEIRYVTFAYLFTLEPPVEENSNGEIVPMQNVKSLSVEKVEGDGAYDFTMRETIGYEEDGVTPIKGNVKYKIIEGEPISVCTTEENAMIMIAPLGGTFDYYHPVVDEQYNAKSKAIIEGWQKVSPKVVGYMYGNNFSTYAEWFDDFSSLPANFQLYADLGEEAGWAFSENSSGVKGSVAFQALRSYVYSKAQWNPYVDTNELIDDFMLNYYKVAAPYLKEYFEFCRVYYASKMHDGEISGKLSGKHSVSFYFGNDLNDYATVLQMGNILNNALVAVENSSYDEYTKIKLTNRIKMETITVRKLLITNFYKYIADSVFVEIVDSFVADCKAVELYGMPDSEWDTLREEWIAQKRNAA